MHADIIQENNLTRKVI